ncbi:Endonuclease/exonuclease/phosphatase superfamily [Arabidopsis suecica]|uniref:Endonuclease/exonuclease/phosphatase superfamily n=1 Tax=Arabidopsis suecica TaxID=45249 RepID=A0A8T2AQ62_ARASU|nr:Endonuclease/exonuclease/phosphatase superfamily [Arabidopsis suecica]
MSGRSPGVSSRFCLGLLLDRVVFAVVLVGFDFSNLNCFSSLGVSGSVLGKREVPAIAGSITERLWSYSVKIHQIWRGVEEFLGFEFMGLSLGGLKVFDGGVLMLVCAFGSVWTKVGGCSWMIRTQRCLHNWVQFGEENLDLRTIFSRRLDLVVNSYRLGHGDDLVSRLRVSRIVRTEISVAESLDDKLESLFLVIQARIEIVLKMRKRWFTMTVRRVIVFRRILVLGIWCWFPDYQEIESLDRSRSYLLDMTAFWVCIQGTEVMFWILKGSVSRAFTNKRAQSIGMRIGFVLFGNLLVTREFLEVVNVKNDALLIEGGMFTNHVMADEMEVVIEKIREWFSTENAKYTIMDIGKTIHLTFVYGDPVPKNRDQVWERLTRIGLTRDTPWFLIGDFNELTGNHEKRGGTLRHASSFTPFNFMIQNCGLLEFPYIGDWLSWRGWRDKKPIRCRLDRALANEDWHELFCNSFVEYLPMVASDHSPVVATLLDKIPRGKRTFRFDKRWIGKDGLMEAISNGWNSESESGAGKFVEKLNNCRRAISQWRRELTPYGRQTIEELKSELYVAQRDDRRSREEITELTLRLKEAYRDEELYWYQKSRCSWMKLGDDNSKYFHALTKQRRARNRITGLHDANGIWSAEDKDIQNIAVSYFKDLFTTTKPEAFEESLAEIQSLITDQVNNFLTAPATESEFGHKVDEDIKEEIKSTLGITNIGGMGSYLGLPESLGGSKTKIFSFVRDRLQTRINGWSAKFLSKGGKEVMIKSVAAALPTYVMSCFRLPKTITSKLTSAVAKFWWGSNGDSRGMHWMAWNKLCNSKSEGGLGFRNVDDFNSALLAKQLWRLITVPDSLFAKVFKGRYFRKSNPLENIKSYSPSYGWRSICSARSLVNKGLIKRVGSGTSISVWEDPWIPAQFPRPAKSNGSLVDPLLKVNNLIDSRSNFWNIALLEEIFDPEDIAIISALPVGAPTKEDTLGWHFTKSGKYTVKSGYHTARLGNLETNFSLIGPDIKPLKAHSWKVHCPPKIRHFLWQILTGCVPVTENLRRRGIDCDTGCARCGEPVETINHTLFQCHPARQVWALSQIPTAMGIFPTESIFANLDHLFWRIPTDFDSSVFPWIIWYIWKARNEKIFDNIDKDPLEVLRLAEKEAQLWQSAQIELHHETHGTVELVNRPRVGNTSLDSNYSGYRCFVDGSWKESDKFSGTGWFCTSSNGEPPTMGAANLRRSLSPLHTEFEALLWAMKCMIGADNQEVEFLTDCSDLVKMVSSPTEWPAFSVYLEEFQSDKEEFSSFSLSLISRNANTNKEKMAKAIVSIFVVFFIFFLVISDVPEIEAQGNECLKEYGGDVGFSFCAPRIFPTICYTRCREIKRAKGGRCRWGQGSNVKCLCDYCDDTPR